METLDRKIEILRDAIEINNERIAGYQKAQDIVQSENLENLYALFGDYKRQSEQFKSELAPFITQFEETVDDGTMVSGKLFRAWMDLKSLVAPSTSESVLASCEKGEDEFKSAYKDLINESLTDFPEIVDLLQTQLTMQLGAHDHIKELRDNS